MAAKPAPPPAPQKKFKKSIKREPKTPDEDYGEVPEPTHSAKKRREKQLEEEKQEKIGKGFYQPKSDEDDTLEPIQSLKEEKQKISTKKSNEKEVSK
uniref:Uncharacterized protein n=1 Tax=Panagrolaimus superbus TaxID=310955 RepID=A0A914XV41_9BILA